MITTEEFSPYVILPLQCLSTCSRKWSSYLLNIKDDLLDFDILFLLVCTRSMWQRAGAVRLFVEHVTVFSEQDDGLNSRSVVSLWKVQTKF